MDKSPDQWEEETNKDVETIARALAAAHMKLINDVLGDKLPNELWQQAIPHARRALIALWKRNRVLVDVEETRNDQTL
jgi:hypothetical protein